jgi:hypothetical protein
MIDKWFAEDIEKILKEKNRIVISSGGENARFIETLIPNHYLVLKTDNEIDELKVKYTIEKDYLDKKIIIFTSTPRENLKFIREYCETCGCIEIKYLHNYVKEKVHGKLGLNLQLAADEIVTAAKISAGKSTDYWIDIVHKGGDRIFDIGNEILPFLHDPEGYCKKLDKQVEKGFFSRLNQWLERENIGQPPATLAKAAAKKILGSLVSDKGEKRFKEVYKSWADSKKYEKSLKQYVEEQTIPFNVDIWAVDVSHPFKKIDKSWLTEITKNLGNKEFIKKKLEIIIKRATDTTGQKLSPTLWNDIICILTFDISQINGLKTLEDTIKFYTHAFCRLDASVRRLYSDFLNENEIIQPFQEYYNQILIQFLDKWFACFKDYSENQTGLLDELITSQKKCAVIVGDGISYDIARDVSEQIKSRYKVDNGYRLADLPSTTEHNMTRIYMGSTNVEPVQKKREQCLVEKYGDDIMFAKLEDVSYTSEPSQFLICTYKDIDSIAEKMQQGALKFISQMVDELIERIDQLMKCGYQKVYLTSDHGFVLTGKLAESDKVEFDFKGDVDKNERYVRTAEKQDASAWLVEINQKSGEFDYIYFHKSNNPFKTPGLYGYAHGGISPQELVVPFISIESKSADINKLDVVIANKENLQAVVGDIFEISLKAGIGKEGLFSMQRKVEILFLASGKQINKSDIISLKPEEVVKKEYSFDGRNELDAIVIDAETKETIDRVTIKQETIRDTGGLFIKKET